MPVREIGKQLGVEYIVEGTVAQSSDRVRITAQLIAVATHRHVWTESYECAVKEGFAFTTLGGKCDRTTG